MRVHQATNVRVHARERLFFVTPMKLRKQPNALPPWQIASVSVPELVRTRSRHWAGESEPYWRRLTQIEGFSGGVAGTAAISGPRRGPHVFRRPPRSASILGLLSFAVDG